MSAQSIGSRLGLRAQILLMLLGGAILPLALVGVWLTSSARRSGETLLRHHLDESADRFVAAVERRWAYRQGDIDLIAGNEATARAVSGAAVGERDRAYLDSLAAGLASTLPAMQLRDAGGTARWVSPGGTRTVPTRASQNETDGTGGERGPVIQVKSSIRGPGSAMLGDAIIDVALAAIVPPDSSRPLVPGVRVGIIDATTRSILVPMTTTVRFPEEDQAEIAGERWLVARRRTDGPSLEIVIAAPLAPYLAPFHSAATFGTAALIGVAALASLLTVVLATRATRPLEDLAAASDLVTKGHLDRRVSVGGPAEVHHVGRVFNAMTEHLATTLAALSRRSALAAVGEFATSLSHDVRNALTAVKVDLERASIRDLGDPVADDLVHRALNNVARLENAVSGALTVARRDHSPVVPTDLRASIRAAVDTVSGTFASIPATVDADLPPEGIVVAGHPAALEQLFANLLFNAAQALSAGGHARIVLRANGASAEVIVTDSGTGMTPSEMVKLDTPFYSSKPNGTGLGLPMARQIVAGHGGQFSIESEAGRGTMVCVRLPLVNELFGGVARTVEGNAALELITKPTKL